MTVSLRSALGAGLAAGLVVTATSAVLGAPAAVPHLPAVTSPAVELSALVTANVGGPTASPGDAIINAYYAVQPWVQYGFEVGAWAFSWLPWPIGLLGPQINIAYTGIQPLSEAVVFSLAYLLDGEFDLILPTLSAGIQIAVNNVIQGEIAWFASFLPPLPPLPFPIFPGASVASRTAAPAAAARTRAAAATDAPAAPAAQDAGDTAATSPSNPSDEQAAAEPEPVAAPQQRRQVNRAALRSARTAAPTAAARPAAATPSDAQPDAARPDAQPSAGRSASDPAAAASPRVARRAR